jgi:hypothetical protein
MFTIAKIQLGLTHRATKGANFLHIEYHHTAIQNTSLSKYSKMEMSRIELETFRSFTMVRNERYTPKPHPQPFPDGLGVFEQVLILENPKMVKNHRNTGPPNTTQCHRR